jgi:hypothetical protein
MTKTLNWIASLVGLLFLGWLLFSFFGVQALFMNKVVDEPTPNVSNTQTQLAPPTTGATSSDAIPPTSPRLIAEGKFQQGDSTYTIKGKATITEQSGIRTVSLTDFDVTNGPDLFVYIVSAADAKNPTVKQAVGEKRFVNLGTLKGNRGNQTYTIPADVELNDQSIVTIWCKRFSRNFGAASLQIR